MAKAKATILEDEERPGEALDQEAMILMVPGYLWNVLLKQAHAEGTTPGTVFSKALEGYLKEHGADEAVSHLWSLASKRK
jgi:hypothetical protein